MIKRVEPLAHQFSLFPLHFDLILGQWSQKHEEGEGIEASYK